MKSRLYVSKENLKYNIGYIKEKIGEKRGIIAMVKANAYGLGDVIVAKELQKNGIENFGVANVEEAIRLRKSGITGMILITSVITGREIDEAIENDISMSVSDIANIEEISKIAVAHKKDAKIHIKLDTGMTRLGFSKDDILELFSQIIELDNINVEGIYTHLSCADNDEEYTNNQIDEFKYIVNTLSKVHEFKYIHILNSDGVQKYCDKIDIDTHVRVGIIMYGYLGGTKPVSKLTAPIIHITNVDRYTKVGYGGTFIAKPNMKIAVVKIGYADGLSRNLSNNLKVKVNGAECEQVGNICMDLMMINVTNVKDVKVNDEVVIWDNENNLESIAKNSRKIVYEVISNLGDRIERVIE